MLQADSFFSWVLGSDAVLSDGGVVFSSVVVRVSFCATTTECCLYGLWPRGQLIQWARRYSPVCGNPKTRYRNGYDGQLLEPLEHFQFHV